ncbi:hypothetical protein Tco_1254694 [Tanacetum coccineum]
MICENMDDNHLNEEDLVLVLVVDVENLLVDYEIQVIDDVVIDPDVENNCVAASEFKTKEGCEMVKVRDKNTAAYRTLYKDEEEEEEEVVQKCECSRIKVRIADVEQVAMIDESEQATRIDAPEQATNAP